MSRIVIAGAGVTGLSIAYEIRRRDPRAGITVVEGSDRVGGNVRSERVDGYLCEWGADGFLDSAPDTLRVAHEVGLASRLMPSNDSARRRFIFRSGRLHEVPVSPGAFVKTGLLSARGKARIAWEPFARRRPAADESIHAFAARRIGEEAASVMIDSMVSGIFAGNAHELSLRACFPKMWQMETEHGGLVKALIATRTHRKKEDAVGAPAGRLTSFTNGMTELTDGLAAKLDGAIRTSAGLVGLAPRNSAGSGGFTVATAAGTLDADALVLTGPASDAADLIAPFDASLASLLSGIVTAPIVVVCLGFDADALARDRGALDGFGFLVPRSEGIRLLGALWETSIYTNRAPEGKALMRVMIGGATDPGALDLDDRALLDTLRSELRRTMGLNLAPEFVRIIRHRRGIPQYTTGHVERLQQIDTRLQSHPGLFLAGNSYRGVSINSCIAEAGPLAERVLVRVTGSR